MLHEIPKSASGLEDDGNLQGMTLTSALLKLKNNKTYFRGKINALFAKKNF
jgi:hypothetical protein